MFDFIRQFIFGDNRTFGAVRSSDWRKASKEYVKMIGHCEATGKTKHLEVHHILPFNLFPEYEMCEWNWLVLTRDNWIHCGVGHNGDFKSFNINAREDAAKMLARIENRKYTREDALKEIKEAAETNNKLKIFLIKMGI